MTGKSRDTQLLVQIHTASWIALQPKQYGRWANAYASASNSVVPADLQLALEANRKAKAFFDVLSRQNRYAILFRIQNVKKAETHARKIAQFVKMLAEDEKLHS